LTDTNFANYGIAFKGCGSYIPSQILSNDNISEIVETSDDWIKARTGISNRRIASINENVTEMGFKAAMAAIEMANWDSDSIDLIVLATSTPSDLFGCAPIIQAKLGAKKAVAFDLTAACSGFLFALITASQYLRSGSYRRAIVIGADQLSSYVDWKDRSSCILFGDGAGAFAIEVLNDDNNLYGFKMKTDGDRGNFLNLSNQNIFENITQNIKYRKGDFSKIKMNGQEVYKFAVREVPLIINDLLKQTNSQSSDIDWLVLHQANQRILDAVGERLRINKRRILSNLANYGNTSAATIPLVFDENVRNKKIKENDLILTSGFGAGLSWGAALFKWG
tara:strand:- start:5528 stop:6535 length:1008 start_codon:yes stop_codon:yes gene_type:complete